jgi:flagellar hook-associated protein 3 FlgL
MMRIGSLSFYESSILSMGQQQAELAKLNQQIASGKKILQPSDAPVAASQVLRLSDSAAARSQYVENQLKAELALKFENVTVSEIRRALTDARATIVSIVANQDQNLLYQAAGQLKAAFDRLYSLANTQDSDGNFIFAGDNAKVQPYVTVVPKPAAGAAPPPPTPFPASYTQVVKYQGATSGENFIEIEPGHQVQVSDLGTDVFGNIFETLYNLKQMVDVAGSDPETDPNFAGDVNDAFTLSQADVDTALANLDAVLNKVGVVENRIVGAQLDVGTAQKTTKAYLNLDLDVLSSLNQLDQAEAIVQLQSRQTALEAAQRAFVRTTGSNLFDYL